MTQREQPMRGDDAGVEAEVAVDDQLGRDVDARVLHRLDEALLARRRRGPVGGAADLLAEIVRVVVHRLDDQVVAGVAPCCTPETKAVPGSKYRSPIRNERQRRALAA